MCPGGLSPVADRDRHRCVGVGVVAELAVGVLAPAAGGVVDHQRTRVVAAGGDAGDPAECGGGVGGVEDRDRHLGVGVGVVAELAVGVLAPAAGGVVDHQRTRVVAAGGDARNPAECGGGVGGVEDRDRHLGVGVGVVAELAVGVLAPAAGGVVDHQRTSESLGVWCMVNTCPEEDVDE
ncbi:hypothetical protein IMCC26207_1092 [Actinobacteria bacterium IMCC26207]|nr:hypothetical protein IMCC26207_1092 [Actinobacteria bacterium IMCC26207]